MSECCSCHINPPCSYCTSRCYCDICNDLVLNEYITETEDCLMCEGCLSNELVCIKNELVCIKNDLKQFWLQYYSEEEWESCAPDKRLRTLVSKLGNDRASALAKLQSREMLLYRTTLCDRIV